MKICIIGTGNLPANPRVVALARSLAYVGHTVIVVSPGASHEASPFATRRVASRVPEGWGSLGGVLRRVQTDGSRARSLEARLTQAIVAEDPDLIYAFTSRDVEIAATAAVQSGAAVVRSPQLPSAGGSDIVDLAPHDLRFSTSPGGPGSRNHSPSDTREPWHPVPGRHSDVRIILAYRATETTPARFLHAAMERAGIEVLHVEGLDWATMPTDVACVVIVESPYPGLEVTGHNPGIPVLLWAHHGEHHTDAHLRLVRRYGADAVLLGHSWHLAHRYPVPVHRFPFGVPVEIVDPSTPWMDRGFDVAFVGSLSPDARAHHDRRRIMALVEDAVGEDRVAVRSGISPEALGTTYGNARVVVNDGGTNHYPITMRVFESIGSGALLATTPTPGLDQLLTPGIDYLEINVETAGTTIGSVLSRGDGAEVAARGHAAAAGRHLYDHRVDELLDIAGATKHGGSLALPPIGDSSFARSLDALVEVGTVAAIGIPGLGGELPLRTVWSDPSPGDRTYDAVVIGTVQHIDEAALADAVRYIVFEDGSEPGDGIRRWVSSHHAGATESASGGIVTVDLGTPGYRLVPTGKAP